MQNTLNLRVWHYLLIDSTMLLLSIKWYPNASKFMFSKQINLQLSKFEGDFRILKVQNTLNLRICFFRISECIALQYWEAESWLIFIWVYLLLHTIYVSVLTILQLSRYHRRTKQILYVCETMTLIWMTMQVINYVTMIDDA